jgi:DNA-binding Lrp family transcriptional regulator
MVSSPSLATSMWSSARYVLDAMHVSAVGRPLLDRLILIAIVQANVQPVTSSLDLQSQYSTLDAVPPEHLRRQVSISALSEMLGLPFETVRRRVRRLVMNGDCEVVGDRLQVPVHALATDDHRRTLAANYDLVRELYLGLRGLGSLAALQPAQGRQPDSLPAIRAVARHSYDHLLRFIAAVMTQGDDVITALLLLTVWRENIEQSYATAARNDLLLDDRERKPVPASRLLRRLGLSEATTHRRLRAAALEGKCLISKRGTIVPAAYLARSEFTRAMKLNHASLGRLFEPLARLGVLRTWDGEGQENGPKKSASPDKAGHQTTEPILSSR